MIYRFWALGLLFFLLCLPVKASELLSHDTYSLKSFGRVQLFIPKDRSQDRVYMKTRFKKPIVKAVALIDDSRLVQAIGTTQTTSVPAELAQKFGSNYREVITFPRSALQSANRSIVFGLETDTGKEIRVRLHGKKLSKILADLR